jgi:hypothetical protein
MPMSASAFPHTFEAAVGVGVSAQDRDREHADAKPSARRPGACSSMRCGSGRHSRGSFVNARTTLGARFKLCGVVTIIRPLDLCSPIRTPQPLGRPGSTRAAAAPTDVVGVNSDQPDARNGPGTADPGRRGRVARA